MISVPMRRNEGVETEKNGALKTLETLSIRLNWWTLSLKVILGPRVIIGRMEKLNKG